MKGLMFNAVGLLSALFAGCRTAPHWVIAEAESHVSDARNQVREAEQADELAFRIERDPSLVLGPPEWEGWHAYPAVLANPEIRFEEKTLLELAYRCHFLRDYSSCENVRLLERLCQRPELTADGLRALEPLLLHHDREDDNWRIIVACLSNPNVPTDILAAYAEMFWDPEAKPVIDNSAPISRLARRRLRARLQAGETVSVRPLSACERFLEKAFLTERTIPEELETDCPAGGWRLVVTKGKGPWSSEEADFVYTPPEDQCQFSTDGVRARLETVHVQEPRRSAADWRKAVRASALTLSFASAEEQDAFLRALVPLYAKLGRLPETGLVHRPDLRRRFGYTLTPCPAAEDGRPRLRLKRAYTNE